MKKSQLLAFVATCLLMQSCLTFRYAIKTIDPTQKNQLDVKREIGIVRVDASQGQRTVCYLTGVFYGGYCWFVAPNEDSDRRALEKGNMIKSKSDEKIEVEYLGRD
jgi:hypothetical protein